MGYYLTEAIDIERHNAEVKLLWDRFRHQAHERVPVRINGSIRNLLSNPEINDTGYSFDDFFTEPDAQVQCQLAYQHYVRHHMLCDREMGVPAQAVGN